MIRNADYVMDNYIIDNEGLAKPAQVGVDLTLNKISSITSDIRGEGGIIYNDASAERTDIKALFAAYEELELREVEHVGETIQVYDIAPGVYSIEFDQGLRQLSTEDTAFIVQRSTLGRNGAMIRSSVYDPGFETPAMGAILYVFEPIRIEQHARVAQIVIHENYTAEEYEGSYQGESDFR
jgi:deoxycytidine triphosphate deaminase